MWIIIGLHEIKEIKANHSIKNSRDEMLKKADFFSCFSIFSVILFLAVFSCNIFSFDKSSKNILSTVNEREVSFDKVKREKKMKVIALLGGITWHSTADYYAQINQ
jgi:hypothetical protein